MKTTVLGAGLVGSAIAIDLSKDNNFEVVSVDINPANLEKLNKYENIKKLCEDVSDYNGLEKAVADCELVINALPSNFGYSALKNLITAKKNVVDITFLKKIRLH